ncbi:uncharacterized protein Z518_00574 [Rhinocladiella mackenziei CBS 650.93]|uniref:peptidyl-tRNA hydrolase n=1 Tax=Rhinocladiella mackenziei CBS 650.93 TaxID=1442369 RepID=A0A0D2ITT7_9EURO|nr:uncharacterized protein Z518_00574 [Rhinocladiella mackenziei CBS 650.93]KIX09494.1 hypothetical protein Z518_00574 [Rhinocladiella mackenziei CBS 650.93]
MANSGAASRLNHQHRRDGHGHLHSQDQHLRTYIRYHDGEQVLYWPEPIDQPPSSPDPSPAPAAPSLPRPSPPPHPPPPPKNVAVIKRLPAHPIISTTPQYRSNDSLLFPITPPPLCIHKPEIPSPQPPMSRSVRLLIASIGNPPPYHSTRHSAGHILLKSLATQLHMRSLSKNKVLGSGSVSLGADVGTPEYTLWQSASMMNVSGTGTLKAWKEFDKIYPSSLEFVTAMVILHDELESSVGTIKLRRGESSPRGHNGIKSIQSALKSAGLLSLLGDRFMKIGVGIGRPASREKDDVSAWVLGQLTHVERSKIEAATESVLAVIGSEIARLERS